MAQILTERERISLLIMRGWGDLRRSLNDVVALFNQSFREGMTPISKSTVSRTVSRFEQTGSVKDRLRSGRPSTATNDEKSLEVLQSCYEDRETSIRNIAQELDISVGSVHTVLKKKQVSSLQN